MAKFSHVRESFLDFKALEYMVHVIDNYEDNITTFHFFSSLDGCSYGNEYLKKLYSQGKIDELNRNLDTSRNDYALSLSGPLGINLQVLWNYPGERANCRAMIHSIVEWMIAEKGDQPEEPLEKRFKEMKRLLGLSELEYEILLLAYLNQENMFTWPCQFQERERLLFFAMALDRAYPEVLSVLTPQGKLRKFRLLDNDLEFNFQTLGDFIDGTNCEALERQFYKKAELDNTLPWSFFGEQVTQEGSLVQEIIKASKGACNILFYGAPGTGKTSFAHALAKEIGRNAFEIQQGGDDGRDMTVGARLVGIEVCNNQEDPTNSLMIVDEADALLRNVLVNDNVFGPGSQRVPSVDKGVANTLLDEMRLPAIWISNAPIQMMDESTRRRFDYSICFERLNVSQRANIWKNLVGKFNLGQLFPADAVDRYAARYETSAGGIATVLGNVQKLAPRPEGVEALVARLMKTHCKLMDIPVGDKFLPMKGYALEGLNVKGKIGLEKVVKAMRNSLDANFNAASEDRPRMNVLLFGPPGTGKTEFVKYLGKELDRKVLVLKGSDIFGSFVGETEQRIARAFARAADEQAILFFDEIDGLVQSRGNAQQNWEVSQVNELLQQMENFDGVMIAATNFLRRLDPAIMRRFTFKLEFGYLDDVGKKLFFERMFKTSLSEAEFAELKTLTNLAPGDFRTVRQACFYLAEEQTNASRIEALKAECALKRDGRKGPKIGF